MKMRKLGALGPLVSSIGLGCMGMSEFYGPADDAAAIAVLHRALALGVNFFDSSDMYGPYTNEKLLGKAFAGIRQQAIIATKFGIVRDEAGVFHMFVEVVCRGFTWMHIAGSVIVHATAAAVAGPYTFSDVALPQQSMTPHLVRDTDGAWLLLHQRNASVHGDPQCTGGVAALACVVGYLHVYLPHYSAASDVARERARAGADAAAVAGGPKKGSTWAAVTKARDAH